jgi:hypothetical protein
MQMVRQANIHNVTAGIVNGLVEIVVRFGNMVLGCKRFCLFSLTGVNSYYFHFGYETMITFQVNIAYETCA